MQLTVKIVSAQSETKLNDVLMSLELIWVFGRDITLSRTRIVVYLSLIIYISIVHTIIGIVSVFFFNYYYFFF